MKNFLRDCFITRSFIRSMNIKNIAVILTICLVAIFLLICMSSSVYAFLYKGLDIKVEGKVREMYDDNITLTSSGNKKEDFITRLTLGLGVKYGRRTRTLDFKGRINKHIFAKYHNFNKMSKELELNFQNEFSKYDRMTLKNVFTSTYENYGFEEEFGRPEGRYRSSRNTFNLVYDKDISKHLTVIAKYTNAIDRIHREGARNSYLNSVGFETNYIYNPDTVFLMSYDFSRRNYDNVGAISTHTVAAGVRQYITKQLYFDGRGGVDFITSLENTKDTGEYIQGSLTDEIDENTTASLSFTKRKQTISYREDFFDSWRISGLFKKQLSEKLGSSFSGFYSEGKYKSLNPKDRLRGISIMFNYNFGENLKGDLTYSDINETRGYGGRYARNLISSGLTIEF